jgi:hypothetical protein
MEKDKPTQVIILGTIHSQHKTSSDYGLAELEAIIRTINPDFILAEIPPDRFSIANKQFQETGNITEPRVLQYPEFSHVVFPLSKELNFKIKPVSAWTEEMADARESKLEELKFDQNRAKDWQTYQEARAQSSKLFQENITSFSPEIIHTDAFDAILEVELSVFNRLFNDDLGKGGWDNINKAHYALIDAELKKLKNQNKKVLIMFGSGHKGWLKRNLKTRTDIDFKNVLDIL